ncbi:histone-binding N1 N2-like isoform X1 [Labeo rohita]|uniref:Histone-binding N1 N2-like isoform X1 n=1 Tax=Labeo rohita TaxID=84645 RepID=A0A498NUH2_LABRO|nr:histone-binding N1 N2-like isoform X1 [Labeo rohita]
MEEKPCSSSAADSSVDVSEEAKKLIGTGNRHLVMGDVVAAVSVFQEACAMLMENTVLGNALEGVPEESSEEGEKQNDSKIESADNLDEKTRDELRAQVYDAMSEDKTQSEAEKEVGEGEKNQEKVKEKQETVEAPKEGDAASPKTEKPAEHEAKPTQDEEKKAELEAKPAQDEEKKAELEAKPAQEEEKKAEQEAKPTQDKEKQPEKDKSGVDEGTSKKEVTVSNGTVKAEKDEKADEEKNGNEENEEPMEEDGGDDDEDEDDDDEDAEGETKDKESEEDEVGNLQLAWEMLEVAKVIYKRKDDKEDQLMAAQIYLKLGEVGAESGNYSQALEDFKECLNLQLKHLPSHSRLLAETHYQLGTTYSYTAQYSEAIEHFSSSIKVIESRLAMLQEIIDKAEGEEAAKEEKNELEELKQLLPEITEKIEDAKESQRTAAAASEAIHQTLIPVRPADGASSSKSASDISHLVRKKRKPDEESPKKDSDAKKTKQETSVNGSDDSAHNGNGVQEKMEQEAS